MAIPRKAFLGDIIYVVIGLTIASLLNFSFLIRSFLVYPESILTFSSRLCASFAAMLCVAPTTLCHINYQTWSDDSNVYNLFFSPGPSYRRLPKITFSKSSTLIVFCYRHPPVASIVESRYLNELVYCFGTHAKQNSSLDAAGLKYSVFFLPILSSFPSSVPLQLSMAQVCKQISSMFRCSTHNLC